MNQRLLPPALFVVDWTATRTSEADLHEAVKLGLAIAAIPGESMFEKATDLLLAQRHAAVFHCLNGAKQAHFRTVIMWNLQRWRFYANILISITNALVNIIFLFSAS